MCIYIYMYIKDRGIAWFKFVGGTFSTYTGLRRRWTDCSRTELFFFFAEKDGDFITKGFRTLPGYPLVI